MAAGKLAWCAAFIQQWQAGDSPNPRGEAVGSGSPGQARTGPLRPQGLTQPRPLSGQVQPRQGAWHRALAAKTLASISMSKQDTVVEKQLSVPDSESGLLCDTSFPDTGICLLLGFRLILVA